MLVRNKGVPGRIAIDLMVFKRQKRSNSSKEEIRKEREHGRQRERGRELEGEEERAGINF